jgi:hypothetical protein
MLAASCLLCDRVVAEQVEVRVERVLALKPLSIGLDKKQVDCGFFGPVLSVNVFGCPDVGQVSQFRLLSFHI